jgi:hypothetical protein
MSPTPVANVSHVDEAVGIDIVGIDRCLMESTLKLSSDNGSPVLRTSCAGKQDNSLPKVDKPMVNSNGHQMSVYEWKWEDLSGG